MALTNELRLSRNRTIRAFKEQLKARSFNEFKHASRVAVYSVAAGERSGFDEDDLLNLRYGAELHDIGKLLWPPEAFTSQELYQDTIRRHPLDGARTVASIEWLDESRSFILSHHERWDGTGYPLGLSRTNIPLGARIIAVAEAFDVMTMPSDWREAVSEMEAVEVLRSGANAQFDPDVVETFLRIQPVVQPVGL
jgi:HD-GYP domain-containing protein (c-di-GMP phosphodiesterase class II)